MVHPPHPSSYASGSCTRMVPGLAYIPRDEMKVESMPSIMTRHNNLYNGTLRNQKVLVKSWRLMGASEDDKEKFTQRLCLALAGWKKVTSHPNILPVLGISGDEIGTAPLSIVVSLCHNGNVNDYLSRNPTANVLQLLVEIAAGIHRLHSLDPPIVHGKLRGANILISEENKPLLTDLCMRNLPLPNDLRMANTRENLDEVRWMAPELVSPPDFILKSEDSDTHEGEATSDLYDVTTASDIYSFGMTALELLTRQPPFAHRKHPLAVTVDMTSGVRPVRPGKEPRTPAFYSETPPLIQLPTISDEVWDFITNCWAHNPRERTDMGLVESWIEC